MRKILPVLLLVSLLVASGLRLMPHNPAQAQTFDRRAMLTHLTNDVILTLHADFVEQTAQLETAVQAFRQEPSAENLTAVQATWLNAAVAWQKCIMFEFGRLVLYHSPIYKVPTSTERIEEYLAGNETLDEAFVESVGSTSKGLPAIEYLIFAPSQDNAAVLDQLASSERRLDYLGALAENLHNKAEALYLAWSPEGENYAETFIDADGEGAEIRESISMLNNQMVAILGGILDMKMGRPMGNSNGGEPRPELVEAPYSHASIALISGNIEGMQQVFNGGFADYLDFLGAEYEGIALSEAINQRFETALTALDAIETPLDIAIVDELEAVQVAYQAIRDLMVLLRVDMASQLGVTITFNDNDGD